MIVKVCGMRQADNIRAVEESGADWMGFICYARSPRFVADTPSYLPHRAKRVAVFVNESIDSILARVATLKPNYLQLHGTETPEFCRQLHERGFHIIKAFAPRAASDFERTVPYLPFCDYLLFDTPCTGYGGSGKTFDWELLEHYHGNVPFLLSGGIRPDSLEALKRFRHPRWAGIDLNSGFETAPAIKDAVALSTFIQQIKNIH